MRAMRSKHVAVCLIQGNELGLLQQENTKRVENAHAAPQSAPSAHTCAACRLADPAAAAAVL